MKVRMRVMVTGTRDGVEWPQPGGILDVPADEAASLVRAGLAEVAELKAEPGPEVAVPVAAETAAAPKPRARKAAKSDD